MCKYFWLYVNLNERVTTWHHSFFSFLSVNVLHFCWARWFATNLDWLQMYAVAVKLVKRPSQTGEQKIAGGGRNMMRIWHLCLFHVLIWGTLQSPHHYTQLEQQKLQWTISVNISRDLLLLQSLFPSHIINNALSLQPRHWNLLCNIFEVFVFSGISTLSSS